MVDRCASSLPSCHRLLAGLLGILAALLMNYPSLLWVDGPLPLSRQDLGQDQIGRFIAGYAEYYDLEPALLHAVIKVESNFNPLAVSSKGARGLMQLMPLTATAFNVRDPFDPQENIRAGAGELRRLLDRFKGNLELALAAYHAGESRVSRYATTLPFRSTELYVRKVLAHYQQLLARNEVAAPSARLVKNRQVKWPIIETDDEL